MRAAIASLLLSSTIAMGCDPSSAPRSPQETAEPTGAKATPTGSATAPSDVITVKGDFKTPESVLYDPAADVYLVSNINGSPLEADGNGFISRVSPRGTIETLKWIDGSKDGVTLNAPKGMALSGGVLYVADLTHVRKFDLKTGASKGAIEIPGATFVNDVAAGPDGAVYVSDMGMKSGEKGMEPSGSDGVYRIDQATDELSTLLKDPELGHPNGLYVDDAGPWVVTMGSGELYRLLKGKRESIKKLPKSSLDGIVGLPGGQLLISSWAGKGIFRGSAAGPFKMVLSGIDAPADIGYDTKRRRLLVPLFNDDQVQIHPLH